MVRIRLQISGIASLAEALAAVEAGADAIGLDPSDFPAEGLAGSDLLADIALALPPAVTPVLLTQALTAGTIAQQVDAAAATAVQILRPLPASEYPGLRRIIRGRKIIQAIDIDQPDARALASSLTGHADALSLAPVDNDRLALCGQIAADSGLPVFLRLAPSAGWTGALTADRPFAIEIVAPRREGTMDIRAIADLASLLG